MDVDNANPWGRAPFLDVRQLAAYLRVPVLTAYDWRKRLEIGGVRKAAARLEWRSAASGRASCTCA